MTEKQLAEHIKKTVTEALQPYLKVERPEGETGDKDEPIFNTFGAFMQSVVRHDKLLAEYCEKTLSMDSDPAGGYLVPEKWMPGILKSSIRRWYSKTEGYRYSGRITKPGCRIKYSTIESGRSSFS